VFPAKRSTLKIGGHSSKWGHVYVAFIKANNQWMLQGISSCCALNSNPRAEARVGKVDPRKVSRALQTIVRTMKEENLWDVSRPNEEAFINMGAHGLWPVAAMGFRPERRSFGSQSRSLAHPQLGSCNRAT
jgi:hypothetical protein